MSVHVCHADGCNVPVPRKIFMCRAHWYALPKPLRDEIWRCYQPGQESGRVAVTEEYAEAARAAVEFIKDKEAAKKAAQPRLKGL